MAPKPKIVKFANCFLIMYLVADAMNPKIHLPLKVPYIELFFEVSVWLKFDFENLMVEFDGGAFKSNCMFGSYIET